MSGPRFVIVSRCFWPIIDDSTLRLQAWLKQFKKLDVTISLVTALWNYRWPLKCSFDETAIQRIGPPPLAARSFKSYTKSVVEHLILQHSNYDAILFDHAAEEAIACCQSKELAGKPKLFWFENNEANDGNLGVPSAVQEACRQADHVLVYGATEERVLRSVGISENKIERIGQVNLTPLSRSLSERKRARALLGECCGDLVVPFNGSVIVVPTSMRCRATLENFLQAIDPLLDRRPDLRVWLIGDGPERGSIYEKIRDMEGARQIALPGCFDSIDEIFQAADVCVLPTRGEGLNYFAPLAWQSQIPCVLPLSAVSKERTPEHARWGLFAPDDLLKLREVLPQAIEVSTESVPTAAMRAAYGEGAWNSERWKQWGFRKPEPASLSMSPAVSERPKLDITWKKRNR